MIVIGFQHRLLPPRKSLPLAQKRDAIGVARQTVQLMREFMDDDIVPVAIIQTALKRMIP